MSRSSSPFWGRVFQKVIAPVLILSVGVGVGGYVAFTHGYLASIEKYIPFERPVEKETDTENTDQQTEATLVKTARVVSFKDAMILTAEGVAIPHRRVILSAEVSGRITKKFPVCRAGNYVNEKEKLLQIDTTYLQAEVDRLNAQVRKATAELGMVDVELNNLYETKKLAKERHDRKNKILQRYKNAGNAITEHELDTARLEELSARDALQSLSNQRAILQQKKKTLAAARDLVKVQLKPAITDLQRAAIASPLNGTIISESVEENQYVRKGDPLLVLNDSSQAQVQCQLRIDDVYWIWLQSGRFSPPRSSVKNEEESPLLSPGRLQLPETPVELVYPFKGVDYIWDGLLDRYDGNGIDPKTRTVPCRVLVKNPQKVRIGKRSTSQAAIVPPTLFAGMYLRIRIPIRLPIPLLKIPMSAMRPGGHVWVVRNGKLRIVDVQIARTIADGILLRPLANGALIVGDQIVISPLASVKDGLQVREEEEKK